MTKEPSAPTSENPSVFVAVATGPPKAYAIAYMFAALQNLNYPNKEIHFAITRYKGGYKDEAGFSERMRKLIEAIPLGCDVHIHNCYLPESEMVPYGPILRNLRLLRGEFLDGGCDYFLLLGGDNPPPREAINHLMKLDADVACGLLYQRPHRGIFGTAYPLLYEYSWTLDELPKDLPQHLRDEFAKAFKASMFYLPIYLNPEWSKLGVIDRFTSGSGCTLIRRRVLEDVGFYLPSSGYHSEDVNFFANAHYLGYSTRCDLGFHVPHHDESGEAY